jgi:hypothetical protein
MFDARSNTDVDGFGFVGIGPRLAEVSARTILISLTFSQADTPQRHESADAIVFVLVTAALVAVAKFFFIDNFGFFADIVCVAKLIGWTANHFVGIASILFTQWQTISGLSSTGSCTSIIFWTSTGITFDARFEAEPLILTSIAITKQTTGTSFF